MNLENKVNSGKPLAVKIGRIALTTAGYALSTIWFKDYQVAMPLAAVIGFSASLYDELHNPGCNLFFPGMGIAVGGMTSSMWFPGNTIAECACGLGYSLFGYILLQEDIDFRKNS